MQQKIKYFFIFCVLITLASCKKKGFQYHKNTENLNNFEQHAKFFDIPIPINAKVIKNQNLPNFYSFSCKKSINELIDFFKNQMEVFGWKEDNCFGAGLKCILVFQKPNKSVATEIEENHGVCVVSIFLQMNSIDTGFVQS